MIRRTLQEIADFFGMAAAVDKNGQAALFSAVPERRDTWWMLHDDEDEYLDLLPGMFDYSGDWRDSLTLPESWTNEPPFKDGEIVINIELGFPSIWRKEYDLHADEYRRPTRAEWKVLRGEE